MVVPFGELSAPRFGVTTVTRMGYQFRQLPEKIFALSPECIAPAQDRLEIAMMRHAACRAAPGTEAAADYREA